MPTLSEDQSHQTEQSFSNLSKHENLLSLHQHLCHLHFGRQENCRMDIPGSNLRHGQHSSHDHKIDQSNKHPKSFSTRLPSIHRPSRRHQKIINWCPTFTWPVSMCSCWAGRFGETDRPIQKDSDHLISAIIKSEDTRLCLESELQRCATSKFWWCVSHTDWHQQFFSFFLPPVARQQRTRVADQQLH